MSNGRVQLILSLLLCTLVLFGLMTASALAGGEVSVSYVERRWNGSEVVSETKTATAVPVPSDGSMTSGWYILDSNVTKNGRVESITGDVHLILGDGFALDVKGLYVPAGTTLTIYGQSADTGTLHSEPGSGAAIVGAVKSQSMPAYCI